MRDSQGALYPARGIKRRSLKMNVTAPIQQALDALTLSAERLRSLSLPADEVEGILDLAALIALRRQLGENRPTFAGFIGCTGSGKSTLFNSLCGRDVCITGWKAHNTAGPVMLTSERFQQTLHEIERSFAPLFLSRWSRDCIPVEKASSEAGTPGALRWIVTQEPGWNQTVLFDLPDINTTRSRHENMLAIALLPWLDAIVFVVDEETLYHRDYESPVAQAKSLQQRRLCVLNHRGRDRVVLDHPDFQGVRDFFGVDTLHVLPDINGKARFDSETAFQRFRDDLLMTATHAPNRPILERITPRAEKLVQENERRRRVLIELEEKASQIARDRLAAEKPIPIHRVLNNEALQVLEHLGLKRFSLSNLLQFFKRLTTTGAITHSFQLAFGSQRDKAVSHLLNLDNSKLQEEIAARLSDHREAIRQTLHNHPDARLLGENWMANPDTQKPGVSYAKVLKEAVDRFDEECRALMAEDTLSSALKNDPLTAASVLIVLIADAMTIPGFGSWVLVPTVFQYIPIGKFEKTKRDFQQRIRDIIRESIMEEIHAIQEFRIHISLENSDPLLKALRTVAGHHED